MDLEQSIYESTLYIHSMYAEPITVAGIAAEAYLSPSYFSYMFRTFTGYTVKNYLNRYRLYRAALDVRDSSKPLVEIAYVNGFSSQQAFTRSFSQMYGIAPAQFRLSCPTLSPFPSENLWTKWRKSSMKLMQCFENVRFTHKDDFFVVGLEADINYGTEDSHKPIGVLWKRWTDENIRQSIPDQVLPGTTYGMTHSETKDDTATYMVGVEASKLDNLPVGLTARKIGASDYAIFDVTLDTLGEFWRQFHARWLPVSGYALPDTQVFESRVNFNKHPDIEVYPEDYCGGVFQVYAPVVKK